MAGFSIGELLTLLDVQDVPSVDAGFPAALESVDRALTFTMPGSRMDAPSAARLEVTPILCRVQIDDFGVAGSATWQHMHDYIDGYLADTLSKVSRGDGLPGFRTYKGRGTTVGYAHGKPGRGDRGWMQLVVMRDEAPAMTIARAFGIALPPLSALTRDWRDVASTRAIRVDAAATDSAVWLRATAPHGPTLSDAGRCSLWMWTWASAWLTNAVGAVALSSVDDRPLGEGERATRYPLGKDSIIAIKLEGERARDRYEVHMPRRWCAELSLP